MMRREGIEIGGTNTIRSSTLVPSSASSSSSGRIRCQDCGNQAKRDCKHLRCRTCCKSRGFQCHTHVKSTWVPVSLRRRVPSHYSMHQQHQIAAATVHQQQHTSGQHGVLVVPNPSKRYRYQNPAPLGLGEQNFPGEVNFPAVFGCVRVSSVDNDQEEYAYQTSVSIGGHIFTGILHDQGPEPEETVHYVTGGSSSAGLLQQHPNFVTSTTSIATGTITSPYPNSSFCPFSTTSPHFCQYPKS